MRTTAAVLTACILLATLAGTMAAAPSTPPADTGPTAPALGPVPSTHGSDDSVSTAARAPGSQDNQSNVTDRPDAIEIRPMPDGDARIALVWERPVRTSAEADAFQRLADEFERGEYDLGYDAWSRIVPQVAAQTGREMSLSAPSYNATLEDGVGRLEQRFTWENFGTGTNETVSVGDAFHLGDGVWLDRLSEGQQLVVRSPNGYTVTESPSGPELRGDDLIWTGPETFRQGDFSITFEREPQDTGDAGSGGNRSLALAGLGGLLLVALLAIAVLLIARSDRELAVPSLGEGDATAAGEDADGATDSAGAAEATESEKAAGGTDRTAEETDATAAGGGDEPAAAPGTATSEAVRDDDEEVSATDESAMPDVDPELLSDEERVQFLLEQNGGRMKQASIVKETGWSNAKVSQLLSRMAEDDEVDKLRIGRENLITLPEVDVTDTE